MNFTTKNRVFENHTMLLGFLLIEKDFTTYEEEGGEYQGGFNFLVFDSPLGNGS